MVFIDQKNGKFDFLGVFFPYLVTVDMNGYYFSKYLYTSSRMLLYLELRLERFLFDVA